MNPLVSVIIPTHNRSRLLKRAIDSVIAQDYPNIEIVVVDDNSVDDTISVVHEMQSTLSNLRFLRLEYISGANAARNFGISFASGRFICGLDDDDEFHPERVSALLESYKEEFAFVFSGYTYVQNAGITTVIQKNKLYYLEDILGINLIGNQVLTTREKILSVGGYDEKLPSAQDFDLWIRLLYKYGKAFYVPKPLYTVYFHEGDTITKSKKKFKGYFACYKKHKHLMTKKQKRVQLTSLYLEKHRRLTWKTFWVLKNCVHFRALFSIALQSNIPHVYRFLKFFKDFAKC